MVEFILPHHNQLAKLKLTVHYFFIYYTIHLYNVDYLPWFDLLSKLDKIPNLNHDVENNIMLQPDFKYYTQEDFLNNEGISQSRSMPFFSTIHLNIRSLSANYDGLTMLLSDLQHSFDVVGLSKTKM